MNTRRSVRQRDLQCVRSGAITREAGAMSTSLKMCWFLELARLEAAG
jgi:hypothetical protein